VCFVLITLYEGGVITDNWVTKIDSTAGDPYRITSVDVPGAQPLVLVSGHEHDDWI
jgi:hypothetical protein